MNFDIVNIEIIWGNEYKPDIIPVPVQIAYTPDFLFYLTVWLYYILVAVALVKGYTYRSSLLKISAFIALILPDPNFVNSFLSLFGIYGSWIIWLVSYVLRIIFAVIFLVSAILLLKKNTGSRE